MFRLDIKKCFVSPSGEVVGKGVCLNVSDGNHSYPDEVFVNARLTLQKAEDELKTKGYKEATLEQTDAFLKDVWEKSARLCVEYLDKGENK